jgi:DDE superfamily endonuclease
VTTARAFRGFRFPAEVILWAVRWYLQFPISYRDLEAMLADRGVEVDHVTLFRWIQRFTPELEKRLRRHLRPCRGPWHVDATYVRVGGRWRYLYRAVNAQGQTIDFLLRAKWFIRQVRLLSAGERCRAGGAAGAGGAGPRRRDADGRSSTQWPAPRPARPHPRFQTGVP